MIVDSPLHQKFRAMTYTPAKATGVSGIGKVTLPAYAMLALTLVGIADAAYVAHGSYSGAPLWSSRFGGDFVGSPVMYETAGRQYLLVPAASTPPRGPGAGTTGPLGWVAFALPAKE